MDDSLNPRTDFSKFATNLIIFEWNLDLVIHFYTILHSGRPKGKPFRGSPKKQFYVKTKKLTISLFFNLKVTLYTTIIKTQNIVRGMTPRGYPCQGITPRIFNQIFPI